MKNTHSLLKLVCLSLIFIFGACNTTDLDITQNPNALTPEQSSVDFFLNEIEEDFGRIVTTLNIETSEVTRLLNMNGLNYANAYGATRFDVDWRRAYQEILSDVITMTPVAQESGQLHHIAIAQIIEAYVLITMVDLFGDVPFSEAGLGSENLNPNTDPGAQVYAAAMTLLNDAIANLNMEVVAAPTQDLFYGGDPESWIKAANSIRMKILVTTRLVDAGAAAQFDAIVASGDFINDPSEDMFFPWGTSNNNPDTRHPDYVTDYTPSGANIYQSNWLMGYMLNDKVGNGIGDFEDADPRMRYYFYRQTSFVPQDQPNLINCVAETAPQHYQDAGDVFCSLPDGYWGRDHGDEDGVPPDGQLRTAFGVYPAGGRVDDSSFEPITGISFGAGGAGSTPIMLSAWTDIMQAEMALAGGNVASAQSFLVSGVGKSFSTVRSFGPNDPTADMRMVPGTELDDAYLTELAQLFNNGTTEEQWDLLGSEYFVTLFGNGIDAFNFYRRTGRPSTLQQNLTPRASQDAFFRSFLYPAIFTETNSSVSQKSGVTTQVFWDMGVPLLAN